MKQHRKLIGLITFLLSSLPYTAWSDGTACTANTPCITDVVKAKIRYHDADLNVSQEIKKKAFKKLIPEGGLATKGWRLVSEIPMLTIDDPQSGQEVYLDETAFQLTPKAKIDCDGLASVQKGQDEKSTMGASVGLGESCKK